MREVLLFGDEEGAAEAAHQAGARHVANVERADAGPKILRSFFDAAQEMARHEVVCFVNCDMVLTPAPAQSGGINPPVPEEKTGHYEPRMATRR